MLGMVLGGRCAPSGIRLGFFRNHGLTTDQAGTERLIKEVRSDFQSGDDLEPSPLHWTRDAS
jgi:hypothetical protein